MANASTYAKYTICGHQNLWEKGTMPEEMLGRASARGTHRMDDRTLAAIYSYACLGLPPSVSIRRVTLGGRRNLP
jgi:hypothetical protein